MDKPKKNVLPRETALMCVNRIEEDGAFLDRVLASSDVAVYESRDRRFIRELVTGIVRHRLRLDRIIENCYNKPFDSLEPIVRDLLRVGLYQLLFMDSVPPFAAVNESVKLARAVSGKGTAGLVNAILRRVTREGEPALPDSPVGRISAETSFPEWLVGRWIDEFGEEHAKAICQIGSERHPTFIRACGTASGVNDIQAELAESELTAEPVSDTEGYYAVRQGTGLFDTDAFKAGRFTVQDPPAGMAVKLLDPKPGEQVLDLCSAPGGKATLAAELMGDTGRVLALDVNEKRLGLVRDAADRLGLTSIETVAGDAGAFACDDLFDRVLLDAPCTGTAVLAKRPDIKWRLTEEDVGRLAGVQRKLLANAATLVKLGGVLVYSTCSLEHEENRDNIEWFLKEFPGFTVEQCDDYSRYAYYGAYLIPPDKGGGTGAYAVRLVKSDTGK